MASERAKDVVLPEHVRQNRTAWDEWAAEYVEPAEALWASHEPHWGIWSVPESELSVPLLPAGMTGLDAIELGCGAAYVSAWMTRRGAQVVGIDNSAAQLATAQRLQQAHGLDFELIHGNAETVPCPDRAFDFAISEYGACLWADPYAWVPEAARLLRPGGQLVFLTMSWLLILCMQEDDGVPAGDRLMRPSFGLHRLEWPDETAPSVEFHLSHANWIQLLRESGFELEYLVEVYPSATAATRYPFVTLEWARQWPCEEVWFARRRA